MENKYLHLGLSRLNTRLCTMFQQLSNQHSAFSNPTEKNTGPPSQFLQNVFMKPNTPSKTEPRKNS
jgi:hypothetical protein